jgi:hypothetical protein
MGATEFSALKTKSRKCFVRSSEMNFISKTSDWNDFERRITIRSQQETKMTTSRLQFSPAFEIEPDDG